MIRPGFAVLISLLLSACVTTTTSRFDDQRDLDQAVQTYIQIGYRHFANNNLFEAKQALNEALALDDKAAGAHLGLARVFEAEQEIELADAHFQRAIRYDGGTEAVFQYGVFLYNEGDYRAARNRFADATDDAFYQRRARSFEYLAVSERRLDHIDAAINAYQRAVTLDERLVNAHLALADLQFEQGNAAAAWQAYQGFADLVATDQAQYGPYSLWLGIRIADACGYDDWRQALAAQLQQKFADSEEYQRFLSWREEA
ncbi:tetratricopeptide repeat protein [Saccharospirillum mangrovi]|uniref:tetratricopeptide repeat protein n=1 Tax=Saccharospirillum mangrovi TaxID=2161747 RepID=UPI000D3913CF|nr:tetratricopeptide repeat protein [Saccharospirillum mangrovi]